MKADPSMMVVDVTHVITLHSDGQSQEYDFGYDIFDSIVQVRELQAKAMNEVYGRTKRERNRHCRHWF